MKDLLMSLVNQTFISSIISTYADAAKPTIAQKQAAYLKDNFSFLGITKPELVNLQKKIFAAHTLTSTEELIEIVKFLWQLNKREYHYTALDLLLHYKRWWTSKFMPLFEYLIRTNSWWDTVDTLAKHFVGHLIHKHPELQKYPCAWIDDKNMWIRRTAILHQLNYKIDTDSELLFLCCTKTMHEKEFFIRKAIGWALREYSKTNPAAVKKFITEQKFHLSPLSIRQAEKYLL